MFILFMTLLASYLPTCRSIFIASQETKKLATKLNAHAVKCAQQLVTLDCHSTEGRDVLFRPFQEGGNFLALHFLPLILAEGVMSMSRGLTNKVLSAICTGASPNFVA